MFPKLGDCCKRKHRGQNPYHQTQDGSFKEPSCNLNVTDDVIHVCILGHGRKGVVLPHQLNGQVPVRFFFTC